MLVSRTPAPVREQTVCNLRNAIVEHRFKPGQRLVERELCELTGVSRTSVREALRQLEAEGLITVVPNKGPTVAVVSAKEAQDIYQVRQVLESLACRIFAEQASADQKRLLGSALKRLENAYSAGHEKTVVDRKDEFYDILLHGCGNTLIHSILKSQHARIAMLRRLSLSRPERFRESLGELKLILAAIRKGDPDAAWNASLEHVRKAQAVALDAIAGSQGELGIVE